MSDNEITVHGVNSLKNAFGWHSAVIFEAGEVFTEERLNVNKTTEVLVLSDPYPECKVFVFKDGELEHEMDLSKGSFELALNDRISSYGKAKVRPFSENGYGIVRNGNLPEYTGAEE